MITLSDIDTVDRYWVGASRANGIWSWSTPEQTNIIWYPGEPNQNVDGMKTYLVHDLEVFTVGDADGTCCSMRPLCEVGKIVILISVWFLNYGKDDVIELHTCYNELNACCIMCQVQCCLFAINYLLVQWRLT